ncbi:hypothetical protein [Cognatishimia sp. F0-27]|uniref:hypothetical protein n=1 Tax=Cognatishimia sp. F0-27 TaxID=2816855 RepID=UPI001D0C1B34|nr:hypothetical protein [Cognatishimia sp. F0-27]MCC1492010.1 hypothetical protein [Cognatishimia sp. F0-27]
MAYVLIALSIAVTSILLMMVGLRLAILDSYRMVSKSAQRAWEEREVAARLAFVTLWIMIFVLGYF